MSLIQHVSSIDGVDREPDLQHPGLPHKRARRVLSYDAFPQEAPAAEDTRRSDLAAYEVSTAKRIAQVIITVLSCWLASGIVYGYASLKPVLISHGVYEDLCRHTIQRREGEACFEQDIKLNLFFATASITANVSALPVGTILDRYGPRLCGICGCLSLAIGTLLLGLSFTSPEFDAYILGNFFLALGGTFIFVPSFHIANTFPKHSGVIVAVVTGSFDASAAVFFLYQLLYEASNGSFGPERFFFGYLVVPALIICAQLTLMPAHSYQTMPQLEHNIVTAQDATTDVHDSDDEIDSDTELRRVRGDRADRRRDEIRHLDDVLGDKNERRQRIEKREERQETSGVWGVLHGQPAHKQMVSPWFILITLLTVLQMLRMNYFIATIESQYEYMLDSRSHAIRISDFFGAALPIGGIISTPFIGLLLDNTSVPLMLAIIVILVTANGILNSLPYVWAGYLTVCLFVLLRPLYYSAMSDYATKVFGFKTFGRVYGTIICISGLAIFAQVGLDHLTHEAFGDNPTPVNAAMTGAGLAIGLVLVAFVKVQGQKLTRERRVEDAGREGEALLGEASLIEESDEEY
jgi:MFS family permease